MLIPNHHVLMPQSSILTFSLACGLNPVFGILFDSLDSIASWVIADENRVCICFDDYPVRGPHVGIEVEIKKLISRGESSVHSINVPV